MPLSDAGGMTQADRDKAFLSAITVIYRNMQDGFIAPEMAARQMLDAKESYQPSDNYRSHIR